MTKNGIEYSFHCPFCQKKNGHRSQKKKFSLRFDQRDGQVKWKCWVADCSIKGAGTKKLLGYDHKVQKKINIDKLSRKFILNMLQNRKDEVEQVICELPDDFEYLISDKDNYFKQRCIKYLEHRGISDHYIEMYKIGYSQKMRRIVFPSYDNNYKMNFWTARTINPKTNRKYQHAKGYNSGYMVFNEFFINWSLPVIIVEGVFDWLNCCNAVPLLGGSLTRDSRLYRLLKQYNPKTILRLDNDALRGRNKLFDLLSGIGLRTYIMRYEKKDLGEYNMKLDFKINRDLKLICNDQSVYVQEVNNSLKLKLQEVA